MIIMFHFYNHEMVGAVFGLGPKLKADMVIHHFATMGLISTAYALNLSRYGIMWQVGVPRVTRGGPGAASVPPAAHADRGGVRAPAPCRRSLTPATRCCTAPRRCTRRKSNRYVRAWREQRHRRGALKPTTTTACAPRARQCISQLEGVKWLFFNLFALVFFVARVAMAPASILYPAITRAFSVLPDLWAALLLVLMAIVCGLQWVWFSKIVAMALGKGGKDDEAEEAEEDDGGKAANGAADKKKQ